MTMMLGAVLLLSLFSACHHDRGEAEERPTLTIYVYGPDQAVPTRGVRATETEDSIKSMQIWVFRHTDNTHVGYLELSEEQLSNLNSTLHSESYRMEIPKDFAENPSDVDIYVMANVVRENSGLTLDEHWKKSELVDAQLLSAYFYDTGKTSYDSRYGLPMTVDSVSMTVSGRDMVLHVSSARLTLSRAVSKVQFAFSKTNARANTTITVDSITLDKNIIPKKEYLFNGFKAYRSVSEKADDYIGYPTRLMEAKDRFEMVSNENPEEYVYQGPTAMSVDEYMSKIADAVEDHKVSLSPAIYLRETDRPLSGTIYYSVDGDHRSTTFAMSLLGRLYRNSTWLVYGYFNAGELRVSSIAFTEWQEGGSKTYKVYNW